MKKDTTGVIVARFQTPELHPGHKYLLDTVITKHQNICVILGSHDGVPTDINPLPFAVRKEMVLEYAPHAHVLEVIDCNCDTVWSEQIDTLIQKHYGKNAILYGSRQSFIPHYNGTFPVKEILPIESPSATDIRNTCIETIPNTVDFRKGIVYSVMNRFPIAFQTVDAALYRKEVDGTYSVLLGHKKGDGAYRRFIGGFVDTGDYSHETAVGRELHEEAGTEIKFAIPEYVCSCSINDGRYRGSRDTVFTTFFALEYQGGTIEAGDDIDSALWFPFDKITEHIIPSHKFLAEQLTIFLNAQNQN